MVAVPPAPCPYCGAAIPAGFRFCKSCHRDLLGSQPRPTPGSAMATDPLSALEGGHFVPIGPMGMSWGPTGRLWLALGISLVAIGIFLLLGAGLFGLVVTLSSQTCATNSKCIPVHALGLFLGIGGTLALVGGVAAFAHGFGRGQASSSWLTLPP